MTNVAFIGLGGVGLDMAIGLARQGFPVTAFDHSSELLRRIGGERILTAASAVDAVIGAQVVVTVLPSANVVHAVYCEVVDRAEPGTLFIDCSTTEVQRARAVAAFVVERGHRAVDAPVLATAAGTQTGTLTFLVGGPEDSVAAARPLLEAMGATTVHCGASGTGQATTPAAP